MLLPYVANCYSQLASKFTLRQVLVAPFVLQIFAVMWTGYSSFSNGQKAIEALATKLQAEVISRIDQHLDTYLTTPHSINKQNADTFKDGLLKPGDLKGAGRYFRKQLELFDVGYIAMTLPTGDYAASGYYSTDPKNPARYGKKDLKSAVIDEISADTKHKINTYNTDSKGNRIGKPKVDPDYDPQKEDWYSRSTKARKPVWSRVYAWDGFPDILAISAAYPMYDNTNKLIRVLNVDLRLQQISDFLDQIKISHSSRTFIIDREGFIIATSSSEKPYRLVNKKAEQFKAADSKDPLIKKTADELNKRYNLNQIKASKNLNFPLNSQQQFAQVTPWQDKYGLNWLIVVVTPESDLMGKINDNTKHTIILCLLVIGLVTLCGFFAFGLISKPLQELSQKSKKLTKQLASNDFASGNLEQIEITGVKTGTKEVTELKASLNQLAGELYQSFTNQQKTNKKLEKANEELEKTNEELEQRVDARTYELKLAKEEAEAAKDAADNANQAKSKFLADMSHELRTPLNGVLNFAQILQTDRTASTKQKDVAGIIYKSGSDLLSLINDLLDTAKIEAGKLELNPTDFSLESLLWELQRIYSNLAEQKEIDFSYQALNQLPTTIRADEKRLRQVLINLLGNAIKFTDKGGVTFKVNVVSLIDKVKSESQIKDVTKAEEPLIYKIRFQV